MQPLFMGYEQAPLSVAISVGWSWNDSTVTGTFTNWFSTEPNDGGDSVEDGDEQCSTILGGGRWNDEECMQTRGLVCAR